MQKLEIEFNHLFDCEQKEGAGVFVFYKGDAINYIGKKSNLIDQIKSHLDERSYRIRQKILEETTTHVDFYPTENEHDASLMEYQLIHKYQPELNQLWIRSSHNFPSYYIRLTMIEDYPRILLSKNGIFSSKNFGPYPYQKPVEMVIEHLGNVYPIANCPYEVGSKQLDQWKQNCPRRENGKCSAPCDWQVPLDEYRSAFEKIEKILTEDNSEIIQSLRSDMQRFSDDYDFENARKMKQLIVYYHSLLQKFDLPELL